MGALFPCPAPDNKIGSGNTGDTKLPEHRHQLPPVISGVIEEMREHFKNGLSELLFF